MEALSMFRQRLATAASRNAIRFHGRHASPFTPLNQASREQQRAQFHHFWRQNTIKSRPRQTLFSRLQRNLRWNSSKPPSPNPTEHLGSPPAQGLSARMRKLSREYGWSAVGVYFALSALDFPFCFLAVRLLGTDRIGHLEHIIIEAFWKVVEIPMPNVREKKEVIEGAAGDAAAVLDPESREGSADWGVEAAQKRNKDDASIWTQLALAYAIHKSFIFIRVPLTAAVTPKVVKTLRGWGWDIGKRRPKPPSPST